MPLHTSKNLPISLTGLGNFVGLRVAKQARAGRKTYFKDPTVFQIFTIHSHPLHPSLFHFLSEELVVNFLIHVAREDIIVSLEVFLKVVCSVFSIRRRIDHGPDVKGRVSRRQRLIVKNLDRLWASCEKSASTRYEEVNSHD